MKEEKGSYMFTRSWFDFAFENPTLINPNHTALFCWFVELNNRLGWINEFGITANECMAATGFKSYKPYKKTFDELVEFGFINVIKKSLNQYQCNIIALVNFTKANTKALDKAMTKAKQKQSTKHFQSIVQSKFETTSHIHLNQEQLNNKQLNKETKKLVFPFSSEEFKKKWDVLANEKKWKKKSHAALQTSLTKLSLFSEKEAIEMIENAIQGGWQGVFGITKLNPAAKYETKKSRRVDIETLAAAAAAVN